MGCEGDHGMISAILKLFGFAVVPAWVTWLVEGTAIVALCTSGVLYLEHRGAAKDLAKLQKSSTALIAKANATIATETAQHERDNAANLEKLTSANAAYAALDNALAERLREFDAYRRAHPSVARSGGGPVATSAGECGALSCGDLASQLAKAGNELAGAAGRLSAALEACQRDRDSLTGAPR